MAEYLHPGVYVERRKGGPAPIAGVSTSNYGTCGFTKMGPTDEATLVTSFEQFQEKFGSFTEKGLVPTEVYAFFANGGQRAYISRVVASDAEKSRCDYEGSAVTAETPSDTDPAPDSLETEFTFTLANAPIVRGSVTINWTDAGDAAKSATDDGEGNLTGDVTAGAGFNTIDYETGEVAIKVSSAVKTGTDFSNDYTTSFWQLDAKYAGVWGNDLRCRLQGSPDYWNQSEAKYTRYDFLVFLYDADLDEYVLRETFEELSLTDTTDNSYFPDVVNDPESGSDLVVVTDVSNPGVPADLMGAQTTDEVVATSTGSETAFSGTLANNDPDVAKTTVVVEFEVSAATYSIEDDGAGGWQNKVGSYLDETGTNTIDYETGAFAFELTSAPDAGDLLGDYYQLPAEDEVDCDLISGSDGGAVTRTEVSHPNLKATHKGMYALGKTDEMLNIGIPDFAGDITVAGDQITEAEARGDWFIILSTPSGYDPQEAKEYRQVTGAWNTRTAALYWPWIRVTDPITGRGSHIPPIGHVAGVYARTDINKNVGKSPGGVEDGRLNFSIGLEYDVELAEIDILNPVSVNSLYQSTETGRVVWGVRTLEIGGEYKYINAQRLMMFLEKSLFQATHWVVFENNNSDLQVRVGQQVESFLLNLYKNNYFAGVSPAEAFFVVCDSTNNPPESVALGRLVCDIGVAINKPAEFVIYRLQQKTAA